MLYLVFRKCGSLNEEAGQRKLPARAQIDCQSDCDVSSVNSLLDLVMLQFGVVSHLIIQLWRYTIGTTLSLRNPIFNI